MNTQVWIIKKSLILGLILTISACSHLQPRPRAWTYEEKTLLVASCLAAGADCYTTKRNLDQPGGYEMNPIIYGRPSDKEVAVYFVSSQGVAVVVAHYYPWTRHYLLGGKMIINTGLAVNNREAKKEERIK